MYSLDFCCLSACFENPKSFVLHKLLFPLGGCTVKRPHCTGAKACYGAVAAGLSTSITLAAATQEMSIET